MSLSELQSSQHYCECGCITKCEKEKVLDCKEELQAERNSQTYGRDAETRDKAACDDKQVPEWLERKQSC